MKTTHRIHYIRHYLDRVLTLKYGEERRGMMLPNYRMVSHRMPPRSVFRVRVCLCYLTLWNKTPILFRILDSISNIRPILFHSRPSVGDNYSRYLQLNARHSRYEYPITLRETACRFVYSARHPHHHFQILDAKSNCSTEDQMTGLSNYY